MAEVGEEEEEGEPEPPTPAVRLPEEATAPTPASTDRSWCLKATREHGVMAHVTWGSLPAASQGTWTRLSCDRAALTPAPAQRPAAAQRPARRTGAGRGAPAVAGDGSDGGAAGDGGRRCSEMREAHHVLPGKS